MSTADITTTTTNTLHDSSRPASFSLESAIDPAQERDRSSLLAPNTPGVVKCFVRVCSLACAACLSSHCNTLAYVLAVLVMLPHEQPFHATPLLYCTLWLWWGAPVLFPASLACAAVQRRSLGSIRPGVMVLVASYAMYFFCLQEHGFLDVIWWGEAGFLKMCLQWCDGPTSEASTAGWGGRFRSDWAATPIRSPCYHKPDETWRPNVTTAYAIDFFREHVFGPAASVQASWTDEGQIAVPGLTSALSIAQPGHHSVLLAIAHGWQAEAIAKQTGWSVIAIPFLGDERVSDNAARVNAVAALLQRDAAYKLIHVYGCSVKGKVAYWAAVTAPKGTYRQALIDSGGTLGPASAKLVGPCGETMAAMVGRWPHWLGDGAGQLAPPSEWPADVGDLMLEACHTTRFSFGVGRFNQWNNFAGTMRSVQRAMVAGCHVQVHEGNTAHCGYFFDDTCAHSC